MDMPAKDRARLRAYAFVMRELGLDLGALDRKSLAEREQIVRDAIGALRRTDEQQAVRLGDPVTLGGQTVYIKPLPIAQAMEYREFVLRLQREGTARAKVMDESDEAEKMAMMLELQAYALDRNVEQLRMYLRDQGGVPDLATDGEIEAALSVAQAQAYPFLRALTPAAQVQITGS